MRVMVLVKATESSEKKDFDPNAPELQKMMAEMDKFNQELEKAGVLITADGLKPSHAGKRVQFDGANRTVTDGPFSETRELVAGYWIWKVKDMADAVAWVKRCPNPMPGPSEIEIRPIWEEEDFKTGK